MFSSRVELGRSKRRVHTEKVPGTFKQGLVVPSTLRSMQAALVEGAVNVCARAHRTARSRAKNHVPAGQQTRLAASIVNKVTIYTIAQCYVTSR